MGVGKMGESKIQENLVSLLPLRRRRFLHRMGSAILEPSHVFAIVSGMSETALKEPKKGERRHSQAHLVSRATYRLGARFQRPMTLGVRGLVA